MKKNFTAILAFIACVLSSNVQAFDGKDSIYGRILVIEPAVFNNHTGKNIKNCSYEVKINSYKDCQRIGDRFFYTNEEYDGIVNAMLSNKATDKFNHAVLGGIFSGAAGYIWMVWIPGAAVVGVVGVVAGAAIATYKNKRSVEVIEKVLKEDRNDFILSPSEYAGFIEVLRAHLYALDNAR